MVLDGTETWNVATGTGRYSFYIRTDSLENSIANAPSPKLCDKFIYTDTSFLSAPIPSLCENSNIYTILTIFNTDGSQGTTVADFKTWLSSNPTTVYYALATATDTEITNSALVAELNKLLSDITLYEGLNNVSLTPSADAQGSLTLSYYTAYSVDQGVAIIDSQARTVTVNGVDAYHLKTDESEFLLLAPGNNKLYLTSETSDDSGYAEVKFKQGYLSI